MRSTAASTSWGGATSLAGFQVSTTGRFWVSTEARTRTKSALLPRFGREELAAYPAGSSCFYCRQTSGWGGEGGHDTIAERSSQRRSGLDEPEDASEIRAVPAVADEGYFQVRVRGDRARRSLCVPPCGLKGDCEENRQNASGNEARNSVGVPLAAANRDH